MAYVTLNDLAGRKSRRRARRTAQAEPQGPEEGMGQDSRQQSWWNWFFTGVGPKPKKPYKEASFKQQKAGATFTPNKKWGGMEFEAKAEEDLNPFEAQGYDAAQALGGLGRIDQWGAGLGQTPPAAVVPAPASAPSAPASSSAPKLLIGALALGGVGALVYSFVTAPKTETKEEAGLRELEEALGVKLRNGKRRRN